MAALAVRPFGNGYVFPLPPDAAGLWKEVFNSDSRFYGGNDIGNGGGMLGRVGDSLNVVLPATGFVILEAQA